MANSDNFSLSRDMTQYSVVQKSLHHRQAGCIQEQFSYDSVALGLISPTIQCTEIHD